MKRYCYIDGCIFFMPPRARPLWLKRLRRRHGFWA
jgi:hypothetical protein